MTDVFFPQRATGRHAAFLERFTWKGWEVLLAFVLGAAAGWAVVEKHSLAVLLALVPVVVWLVVRPALIATLVGASLPVISSIAGNSAGGLNVSPSDLLLVLAGFAILLASALGRTSSIVRSLRPVAAPVLLYSAFVLILLGAHIGGKELVKTGQRYELFLLPLLVGAFVALQRAGTSGFSRRTCSPARPSA